MYKKRKTKSKIQKLGLARAKALHIVNVERMGYMKATQGPNGTIVVVLVDPVASARKWSHK
jgi:hypothetical protein